MLQPQTVLPTDYCLLENRIDIWEFSLKNTDHLSLLPYEMPLVLAEAEEKRANRFFFPHHQRRFRVAHLTLRVILAHYLNKPIQSIVYECNRHGKPFLSNTPLLQFNLSHSEDSALLAIGLSAPMGIDIEYFSAREYAGIVKNLYSLEEQVAWNKLSSFLQTLSFFHIWAQKEAFIKAVGMGLAYPTETFTTPVLPYAAPFPIRDSLHGQAWQLLSFMPEIKCSAALCCVPSIKQIRYIRLNHLMSSRIAR